MEIAFHLIAFHEPVGQRARAVGAGVLRHKELTLDIEHGEVEIADGDELGGTGTDIGGAAERNESHWETVILYVNPIG
jgi:hypothetical protein